jgi:predicted MPP superfamily phosphohydrolase
MSIFAIILAILAVSQAYWAWRGYRLATRVIRSRGRRILACGAAAAVYATAFWWSWPLFGRSPTPVELTLRDALVTAPFLCWLASSLVAFLMVGLFAIPQGIVGAACWVAARRRGHSSADAPASPERRVFLGRTAAVAVAAPFVGGAYGLLYGRLNLETTAQPIRVGRLPGAFEGFRICQLSDIHIGPFMPASEIRKYVAIANALKPDLTVLTGDFVTFDPSTQQPVVEALSGLRAPFGVFGSLGNHDAWSGVEDSIAELFRQAGVRILRGTNVEIAVGADSLNLIGVDFQSHRRFGPSAPVVRLLGNIESVIARDRVNILLSHNPDTFERATELGIELSLAGHTHGGQAALEFISPEIAPSRLVTPYVAGLFHKPGSQLYVNRGIGTIGIPIRIGAPPEITLYSLTRD